MTARRARARLRKAPHGPEMVHGPQRHKMDEMHEMHVDVQYGASAREREKEYLPITTASFISLWFLSINASNASSSRGTRCSARYPISPSSCTRASSMKTSMKSHNGSDAGLTQAEG